MGQEIEQAPRRVAVQHMAIALMLDDRASLRRIMLQIGQADAIDSGRMPACPAAPDQSRNVKKQRRVRQAGQRTVFLTVATGRIEEAMTFTKR